MQGTQILGSGPCRRRQDPKSSPAEAEEFATGKLNNRSPKSGPICAACAWRWVQLEKPSVCLGRRHPSTASFDRLVLRTLFFKRCFLTPGFIPPQLPIPSIPPGDKKEPGAESSSPPPVATAPPEPAPTETETPTTQMTETAPTAETLPAGCGVREGVREFGSEPKTKEVGILLYVSMSVNTLLDLCVSNRNATHRTFAVT